MFVCVFKSDKKCWSGNNVKETDGQEIFALKLKTVTYITINYETRRKKVGGWGRNGRIEIVFVYEIAFEIVKKERKKHDH